LKRERGRDIRYLQSKEKREGGEIVFSLHVKGREGDGDEVRGKEWEGF